MFMNVFCVVSVCVRGRHCTALVPVLVVLDHMFDLFGLFDCTALGLSSNSVFDSMAANRDGLHPGGHWVEPARTAGAPR